MERKKIFHQDHKTKKKFQENNPTIASNVLFVENDKEKVKQPYILNIIQSSKIKQFS